MVGGLGWQRSQLLLYCGMGGQQRLLFMLQLRMLACQQLQR